MVFKELLKASKQKIREKLSPNKWLCERLETDKAVLDTASKFEGSKSYIKGYIESLIISVKAYQREFKNKDPFVNEFARGVNTLATRYSHTL